VSALWFVPTRTLLAEREGWAWLLADLDVSPQGWDYPAESRAYLQLKLREIDEELSRRQRARQSRLAPAWPAPDRSQRQEEWAEIKRRLPLQQFIEQHAPVTFRRVGDRLVCRCPFPDHPDDSPSFVLYPDDSFYCFGCRRGGDLFVFARHLLGLPTFGATAQVLRNWAGLVTRPAITMPDGTVRVLQ
jgi:hypothetical protein